MKSLLRFGLVMTMTALPMLGLAADPAAQSENPRVRLTTSLGAIELELDARRAPGTVRNFMNYVQTGFYHGTVFHRVIPGFMIQGGGFRPGLDEKAHGVAIKNEANNGLRNLAGTIAMARTRDPHSASAQFFINTVDNANLDHRDQTTNGWGYSVFGKVTKGMDVVKKIETVPTGTVGGFENVPKQDVVILKVEAIK